MCVRTRSSKERAISYERAWLNEKSEGKAGKKGEHWKRAKVTGWGRNIHLGEEGGKQQELNKHGSTRTATHTHAYTHTHMHAYVCVCMRVCVCLFFSFNLLLCCVRAVCLLSHSSFVFFFSSSVIHVTTGGWTHRKKRTRNMSNSQKEKREGGEKGGPRCNERRAHTHKYRCRNTATYTHIHRFERAHTPQEKNTKNRRCRLQHRRGGRGYVMGQKRCVGVSVFARTPPSTPPLAQWTGSFFCVRVCVRSLIVFELEARLNKSGKGGGHNNKRCRRLVITPS